MSNQPPTPSTDEESHLLRMLRRSQVEAAQQGDTRVITIVVTGTAVAISVGVAKSPKLLRLG